ncbi:MT-A70 family methyltransferase [Methylocystis sp. S23]
MRPFGMARRSKGVIVVDPPWLQQMRSAKGEGKAPQAHYRCMTIEEICALPVGELAFPDCWLFLWTCAPLLDKAFVVMNAWGFDYCTRMAWRKIGSRGGQKVGPGFVVRTMHEDILIGKRGEPPQLKALPSIVESEPMSRFPASSDAGIWGGSMFDGLAREHSRKPDEFYRLVEDFALSEHRADLFARTRRPGWESFGDELGKFEGAA